MERSIVVALGLVALTIAACGGGTTYSVTGRGPALSADARIEVVPTGPNRQVVVAVDHLLPPERLGQEFSTYTVWIVPRGGAPVPAGRLDYDRSRRRGRLTTITPYEEFRLLVTAEPATPLGGPSRAVVLSQDVVS